MDRREPRPGDALRRLWKLRRYWWHSLADPEFRARRAVIERFSDRELAARGPGCDPDEHALPGLVAHRASGWNRMMYARYLAAFPDAGGREVLDAGCGLGWGSYLLAGRARRVTGVDRSAPAIAFAQAAWPADRLEFVAADLLSFLAGNRGRFGLVVAMETLEHFDRADGERYLAGLADALAPGGALVVSSGFPATRARAEAMRQGNPHHRWLWTKSELRAALAPRFRTLRFDGSTLFRAQLPRA